MPWLLSKLILLGCTCHSDRALRTLRSTTRQARRRVFQNVKNQCEFLAFKTSHDNLATVFDVSTLFQKLQDAPVLLKRLYCLS